MLIEISTEWTSTVTGPLNPAIVTWGFDSPSGAPLDIELDRCAAAVATSMFASVTKSALGAMQFVGAKWKPAGPGTVSQPIAMTNATWDAMKAEFTSSYRALIPTGVPTSTTTVGSASYSGRGDSLHLNKRVSFGGSGPKRGGAYLPFLAVACIDTSSGLLQSTVSSDVSLIWNGMMRRVVNAAWAPAGPITPLLESVVIGNGLANGVNNITVSPIPSRLRSRLR